ncbi:EthD family reductase [Bradyrhizobium sp. CER78]|uniref:EthD family reductase n=1 Tax=Bradyrhizobium sp. CER78 TaxID=3039162 RepID=UPI002449764E|nr:EthD family reductase [Bradyrhizobium sp. CER78]MDH2386411.1 EthD family reductase [Bradyrhizobium sp. CER78]
MYPNKPDARFDDDYYCIKHLPLIKSRMGGALKYYTIDKGLADRDGRRAGAYVAMCHLLCDSLDECRSAFGPHAHEIDEDIRNFTDVTPI